MMEKSLKIVMIGESIHEKSEKILSLQNEVFLLEEQRRILRGDEGDSE